MKTEKLYDKDAYATAFKASVVSCRECSEKNGKPFYEVILDKTLFFPEEGGQTADKGTLNRVEVLDVQIKEETIIHILEKALEEGTEVTGEIDWKHRFFNMQQHSGEHIFSGLAYKRFGYSNVGFHLSNQIVTMDFNGSFTEQELEEMEWSVNEAIVANVEIKTGYPSKEELESMEYRSKIDIAGAIRIVEIPGYDVCACCAPHVCRTGEIGMFKIQSAQKHKGGTRISFLCGFRALEEYRKKAQIISELTGILTTSPETIPENVTKLKTQVQSLKTKLDIAKQTLLENKVEMLPAEQKNVFLFERDIDTVVMRNIVNKMVEKHSGACGIFTGNEEEGYSFIIGSKNVDCRELATKMREELEARGGGSAAMIQGSVKKTRIEIESCLKIVNL